MLRVRLLGRVPYQEATALQHALARRSPDDYLLVLEHPHVYTLGVRADPAHVLVDPASVGAEVASTDRGGDVTYHGPGQLVLYPVLTVDDDPGAGRRHVERIEEVVISTLRELGVEGSSGAVGTLEGYPGVWVGLDGPSPRKIAAVGVRTIRDAAGRRRTLHGVALNVDCDLAMFGHIVPCGISEYGVTSVVAEGVGATTETVAPILLAQAEAVWSGPDGGVVDRASVVAPGRPSIPLGGPGTADPLGAGSSSTDRPTTSATTVASDSVPVASEGAMVRRLRRAGVDPDAALPVAQRKPEWLRVPVRIGTGYRKLDRTIRDLGLVTVCEEAGCPNIYECWAEGTATFMVNGSRCTRACGFCQVDTRRPLPLDPSEPERVAVAVERMGLDHAVVTCVARDDLPDGGAAAIASTIRAIRASGSHTAVEVLISDCKGDPGALGEIFDARPDILNHNIETVARLQRAVRPSAGYARSLSVLSRAADAGLVVKSGLMVGLGETEGEVVATLADLASVGVSLVTIGQYLRPTRDHLPVTRYWTPEEFGRLGAAGRELGLAHVEASPLARSSYHAKAAAEAGSAERAGGSGPRGSKVPAGAVPVASGGRADGGSADGGSAEPGQPGRVILRR